MNDDRYICMAEQMYLIRYTEEKLLELFSKGLLNGTVHTCIGQEACAVGVINALDVEKDIVFSNHRGHGHYITYSGDISGLLAEIMGKKKGVCGGLGGSQHIQKKNYYSNGIQGAGVPIVAGMALAEKIKGNHAICVAFIGDGTFGEGIIYETFNISSLWELPMLIVVEHNQYAQSTPTVQQHTGDLGDRARAFGYKVSDVNGMNLKDVYENATRVVDEIRQTNKPQMLILHTYRFSPHSKGDDFRAQEEINSHRMSDPLEIITSYMSEDSLSNLKILAKKEIDRIVSDVVND